MNKSSDLKVFSTIFKNSIAENSFNVSKACTVYENVANTLTG